MNDNDLSMADRVAEASHAAGVPIVTAWAMVAACEHCTAAELRSLIDLYDDNNEMPRVITELKMRGAIGGQANVR